MTNQRKKDLFEAGTMIAVVVFAVGGPRLSGLMEPGSGVLMGAMWGGLFGGLAGLLCALLKPHICGKEEQE